MLDSPLASAVCGGMADPFQDRVAVVTGGGSGIGAAMASAFAARGARVVLADIDPDALERSAATVRARGCRRAHGPDRRG